MTRRRVVQPKRAFNRGPHCWSRIPSPPRRLGIRRVRCASSARPAAAGILLAVVPPPARRVEVAPRVIAPGKTAPSGIGRNDGLPRKPYVRGGSYGAEKLFLKTRSIARSAAWGIGRVAPPRAPPRRPAARRRESKSRGGRWRGRKARDPQSNRQDDAAASSPPVGFVHGEVSLLECCAASGFRQAVRSDQRAARSTRPGRCSAPRREGQRLAPKAHALPGRAAWHPW